MNNDVFVSHLLKYAEVNKEIYSWNFDAGWHPSLRVNALEYQAFKHTHTPLRSDLYEKEFMKIIFHERCAKSELQSGASALSLSLSQEYVHKS